MTEIRAAEACEQALDGVAALLAEVFPGAPRLDRTWLAWSELGNPLGPSLHADALLGERPVAHVAARWLRARIAGSAEPQRGLLVHHAATRAAFRGRGLLVALVEAALARGVAAGAAFAVAVVNRNSFGAFTKRLGFAPLRPLSVRLGPGRLPARDPSGPPPAFETVRDPDWLAWRLAPPVAPYRVERCDGRAVVWADSGTARIPVALAEADADALPALAPFGGFAPLRLWVGRDAARRFRPRPWLELPLALRPSPLQLVFRPLDPAVPVPAAEHVRFEAIDFDAW